MVLSSTPGNAKPIFRTVSKLILLLGMAIAIIDKIKNLFKAGYGSVAYSVSPCFRMGMSGTVHAG
jgi:hypothetical protein